MRAMVVHPGPHFSVADVHAGWVKGLRANGVETVDFNLDARLDFYAQAYRKKDHGWVLALQPDDAAVLACKGIEAACYEFWPDVVIIISGFYIADFVYEVMRARGHKIVIVHTESPYEDDRQLGIADRAHLNVLNDPTNLDRYPKGSVYIPHGYDPDVHRPAEPEPALRSDFAFVGTGFPSRCQFFEAVDWGDIDAVFAGNWQYLKDTSPLEPFLAHEKNECCPNDQTARLYHSTKASANLYRKEASASAEGWAMGPREVELAACGVFYLREARGEGDELFPMLPTFDGPQDFGDQLRWWLSHDTARQEAAAKAREAVADRTFANHAAELLRLLD